MHFLSCSPYCLSWLLQKQNRVENANCLLVFIAKNLTNSVLSPGQVVGRELCLAAAAGQRAAAWTDGTVSKPELHSSSNLFSYKIFMSPCFS